MPRIDQFGGLRTNVFSPKLKASESQTDQGGDRFEVTRWKRRRGMRHTNTTQFSGEITAILGFDLPGQDYATIIVSGGTIYGLTNVNQDR